MSTQSLQARVQARKEQLTRYLTFVGEMLRDHGVQTHREQHRDHTHTKRELKNWEEFSFAGDWGQTSMGGNEEFVRYQGKLVLHVYYQAYSPGIDDIKVRHFDPDLVWQKALDISIKRKDKVLATRERQRQARLDAGQRQRERQEWQEALRQDAERLGLAVED